MNVTRNQIEWMENYFNVNIDEKSMMYTTGSKSAQYGWQAVPQRWVHEARWQEAQRLRICDLDKDRTYTLYDFEIDEEKVIADISYCPKRKRWMIEAVTFDGEIWESSDDDFVGYEDSYIKALKN